MIGSTDTLRLLYLANLASINGRSALRGTLLVEAFLDQGWSHLVRNTFVEDAASRREAHPAFAPDLIDADEFHRFSPDVVIAEGGLYHPATSDWRLPANLAVEFVENGGVFLVLDADVNCFLNKTGLEAELPWFGAYVDTSRGVPCLEDQVSNAGNSFREIVARPTRQLVSDWLRPAFEGVDSVLAILPVPLTLVVAGDIAASTEATARKLALDMYIDDSPQAAPIATIRQHGNGYAGIVAATVSPDDLTRERHANVRWLVNLTALLHEVALRNRRVRGESPPRWLGHPWPTEDLVHAPEDEMLELKETARFDVRAGTGENRISDEVVEAVAEFWNSEGGVLLIGIRDEPREVVGLDRDKAVIKPHSTDGIIQHITQKVGSNLGQNIAVRLRILGQVIDGRELIRVDVPRGDGVVFLGKNRFRVRRQNGGIDLEGSEMLEYIRRRFR